MQGIILINQAACRLEAVKSKLASVDVKGAEDARGAIQLLEEVDSIYNQFEEGMKTLREEYEATDGEAICQTWHKLRDWALGQVRPEAGETKRLHLPDTRIALELFASDTEACGFDLDMVPVDVERQVIQQALQA